jgi:hypothetical protein
VPPVPWAVLEELVDAVGLFDVSVVSVAALLVVGLVVAPRSVELLWPDVLVLPESEPLVLPESEPLVLAWLEVDGELLLLLRVEEESVFDWFVAAELDDVLFWLFWPNVESVELAPVEPVVVPLALSEPEVEALPLTPLEYVESVELAVLAAEGEELVVEELP